jgi:hypothetical protein
VRSLAACVLAGRSEQPCDQIVVAHRFPFRCT